MMNEYGLKPLKKKHFRHGMEYYREEYDNVVFLYVSDDMPWGRKNIKNDAGDIFFDGKRP